MVSEHVHSKLIESCFSDMGLRLSYGRHVDVRDVFDSSPVASRVADLHEALADPEVKGILTVIGGFNSNELLAIWTDLLIAVDPQVVCACSDIAALQNAIFTDWPGDLCRAALVQLRHAGHFDLTQQWLLDAVVDGYRMDFTPSPDWTDDAWFSDQDNRSPWGMGCGPWLQGSVPNAPSVGTDAV